jgi:hypothetical protein
MGGLNEVVVTLQWNPSIPHLVALVVGLGVTFWLLIRKHP